LERFYLVVLELLLRATTKKKVVNFLRKKVHRRQNPGYAYWLHRNTQYVIPRAWHRAVADCGHPACLHMLCRRPRHVWVSGRSLLPVLGRGTWFFTVCGWLHAI